MSFIASKSVRKSADERLQSAKRKGKSISLIGNQFESQRKADTFNEWSISRTRSVILEQNKLADVNRVQYSSVPRRSRRQNAYTRHSSTDYCLRDMIKKALLEGKWPCWCEIRTSWNGDEGLGIKKEEPAIQEIILFQFVVFEVAFNIEIAELVNLGKRSVTWNDSTIPKYLKRNISSTVEKIKRNSDMLLSDYEQLWRDKRKLNGILVIYQKHMDKYEIYVHYCRDLHILREMLNDRSHREDVKQFLFSEKFSIVRDLLPVFYLYLICFLLEKLEKDLPHLDLFHCRRTLNQFVKIMEECFKPISKLTHEFFSEQNIKAQFRKKSTQFVNKTLEHNENCKWGNGASKIQQMTSSKNNFKSIMSDDKYENAVHENGVTKHSSVLAEDSLNFKSNVAETKYNLLYKNKIPPETEINNNRKHNLLSGIDGNVMKLTSGLSKSYNNVTASNILEREGFDVHLAAKRYSTKISDACDHLVNERHIIRLNTSDTWENSIKVPIESFETKDKAESSLDIAEAFKKDVELVEMKEEPSVNSSQSSKNDGKTICQDVLCHQSNNDEKSEKTECSVTTTAKNTSETEQHSQEKYKSISTQTEQNSNMESVTILTNLDMKQMKSSTLRVEPHETVSDNTDGDNYNSKTDGFIDNEQNVTDKEQYVSAINITLLKAINSTQTIYVNPDEIFEAVNEFVLNNYWNGFLDMSAEEQNGIDASTDTYAELQESDTEHYVSEDDYEEMEDHMNENSSENFSRKPNLLKRSPSLSLKTLKTWRESFRESQSSTTDTHRSSDLTFEPIKNAPLYQVFNFSKRPVIVDVGDRFVTVGKTSLEEPFHIARNDSLNEEAISAEHCNMKHENSICTTTKKRHHGFRTKWQETEEVISSGLLEHMTTQERNLQEAKFEFITSELSYYKSLCILDYAFVEDKTLKDIQILPYKDRKMLFQFVKPVKKCSQQFLQDLVTVWEKDLQLRTMGDTVLNYANNHFGIYVDYCANLQILGKHLEQLKMKNKRFSTAIKKIEEREECEKFQLLTFLTLPMQRVTRFPLLADSVLKYMAVHDEEYTTWCRTLEALNELARQCDSSVKSDEDSPIKKSDETNMFKNVFNRFKTKN